MTWGEYKEWWIWCQWSVICNVGLAGGGRSVLGGVCHCGILTPVGAMP